MNFVEKFSGGCRFWRLRFDVEARPGIDVRRQLNHSGEMTMKFMLILKSSKESEAGKMPSEESITAMVKYNQEQAKAGILLDAAGLYPSSKNSARIQFSVGGKTTVTDGPFIETKELVAGYWLIKVNSLEEAIEWAKRSPFSPKSPDQETEIEVREFIDFE
jgi:hypothetical protein